MIGKRRTVFFTDEEWADAKERADLNGMTLTDYIRSSVIGGSVTPKSIEKEMRSPIFAAFRPAPKPITRRKQR